MTTKLIKCRREKTNDTHTFFPDKNIYFTTYFLILRQIKSLYYIVIFRSGTTGTLKTQNDGKMIEKHGGKKSFIITSQFSFNWSRCVSLTHNLASYTKKHHFFSKVTALTRLRHIHTKSQKVNTDNKLLLIKYRQVID